MREEPTLHFRYGKREAELDLAGTIADATGFTARPYRRKHAVPLAHF